MNSRKLFVDFALHADDDLAFKNELINHMIADLRELKDALELSQQASDMSCYRKACHKVNSTITLLADEEFKNVVKGIKENDSDPDIVDRFNSIYSQLVQSLTAEKNDKPS